MFIYIASAGGVGGLCKKTLAQLSNESVTVVLCKPDLEDIEMLCAKKSISYIKAYQKVSWLFRYKVSLGILGAIIYIGLKYKPKKIFCWGKELALLVRLASPFQKIKLSFFSGSFTSKHIASKPKWRRKISRFLYAWCFKSCEMIGVQTKDMGTDLIENFDVGKQKIIVTPPFIDEVPSNLPVRDGTEIVFLGRLAAEKNIEHLLKGYVGAKKMGVSMPLAIYGEGDQRLKLEAYAGKLGLNKSIFKGRVDTAYEALKNAKVLVLTSHFEGFPTVIIEALAHGVPVVSYNFQSGPSEIIMDGMNGYLVPYKDISCLTERIQQACERKWDRKVLQKSAKPYQFNNVFPHYFKLMGLTGQ